MAERSHVLGSDPSRVDRARHQRPIATGILHPLEILPGEDPAAREKTDLRMPAAQQVYEPEVHAHATPDSREIEHQHAGDAAVHRLLRERYGVGMAAREIVQTRVDDRGPEAEIQTEDDPVGPRDLHDDAEIGERPQRFHADDRVRRSAGEYLQGTIGPAGCGIDQQLPGEAGLKAGELADESALDRSALEGVQVGDLACGGAKDIAVCPHQRERVAGVVWRDGRPNRSIRFPDAALRVHGDAASNVDDRDDLHALLRDW